MKKKVLIFTLDYLPGIISGAEEALKEVTDRLPEIEWHMVTLYYDSAVPRTQQIGNVFVHYVGLFGKPQATLAERKQFPLHLNKYYFQFAAAMKGWQLHRQHRFDAAWAMMAHSTGVPAVLFSWLSPKVPYLLTLEEGDPPEHIERMVRPLWFIWKRCFTGAKAIYAISEFLAAWARRRGATCPIHIIRNGANPESIHPNFTPEDVRSLAESLGKQPGEVWLVNTARLVHQKGYETSIDALTLLPSHIKLLIVGGGPDEQHLRAYAASRHLADRVIFTGQVDRDVVSTYRLVGDIFVGPSRSEGLGNAFLSAMASEIPVIATQVGGLADFIFDRERNPGVPATAFAVDPDQPEQIAAQVTYILDHQAEVKETTARAKAMVLVEYDWDIVAGRVKEVLGGLMRDKPQ